MLDACLFTIFYSRLIGAPPSLNEKKKEGVKKKKTQWKAMHVADPPPGGRVDAAVGECTQNA